MTWLWMYLNWIEDQNEKHKFAQDYGLFIGSFSNPEAAKKIKKSIEPDYESSDEDFEKSMDRVIKDRDKINDKKEAKLRHSSRRRKVIK